MMDKIVRKQDVSEMNSYQVVKQAIEFDKPARVPLMFPWLEVSDVYTIWLKTPKGWKPQFKGEDEWGAIWQKPNPASGIVNMGHVKNIVIEDLGEIDTHKFPDPNEPSRYEDIDKDLLSGRDKYIAMGWLSLFERAWQLHGMKNLFIDFYDKPEQVHRFLDRITEFILGSLSNLKSKVGKIHGFIIGDDWGTQQNTFISIPLFRKFFKPCYKEIIELIHKLGMHAWLHSDGKINDLMEEFIDIGLDVVNIQSPHVLGIEKISRRYRGRITFWCSVDLQETLPFGSRKEIENEAKTLINTWGTPEGGFIGSDYGWTTEDHIAIGVGKKRVRYALEAFRKYGMRL